MGKYALFGAKEYTAYYINKVDLNQAREHRSISSCPQETAARVCNHQGPLILFSTQAEINTANDNTIQRKHLIACVTMDDTISPGLNGDNPFSGI